ncbi:MAG TPA: TIGR02266 family protein [Polyangiaceae bacterium]
MVPEPERSPHESGTHERVPTHASHPNGFAALKLVPEGAPAGDERRENERRACAIELEFSADSHFFAGLSEDISEGGLFVATYERLPIGTRLALSFELQDGLVEARGEVRWVRGTETSGGWPGLGIAFMELSPEASERIARYCARCPPLYVDV